MSEDTEETTNNTSNEETVNPASVVAEKTNSRSMVVKAKRRYHPNEKKYDGRASTADMLIAQIEYAGKLTPEQSKLFKKNKLIYDQAKFDEVFDTIAIGDIIGYQGKVYKVLTKHRQRGMTLSARKYRARNDDQVFSDKEDLKVSIYDFDFMLNLGNAEILYKDGKPYGVSEDLEYKVKVNVYTDANGNQYVTQSGKEVKPGSAITATTEENTDSSESAPE